MSARQGVMWWAQCDGCAKRVMLLSVEVADRMATYLGKPDGETIARAMANAVGVHQFTAQNLVADLCEACRTAMTRPEARRG